jgi:hypothetical protein
VILRIAFESPRSPKVTISFRGYTNDAAGTRQAIFAVANSDASVVEWSAPAVEIKTPTGGEIHFVPGNTVLKPGASKTLTVPPPANQAEWRLRLQVYPDVGARLELKRFVTYTLLRLGLKPRYQTMPYSIKGEWIKNGE